MEGDEQAGLVGDHHAEGSDEEGSDEEADEGEEQQWLLDRAREARRQAERRERAELDERLDHLPFTLREASRAVDDVLTRQLRSDRLTDLPLTAIHALVASRYGKPIVRVAARLRISPQAAGRAVRLLADRGLATTSPSRVDARVRLVEPTEEGEQLLRDLRRSLLVAVSVVTDSVGDERLLSLSLTSWPTWPSWTRSSLADGGDEVPAS